MQPPALASKVRFGTCSLGIRHLARGAGAKQGASGIGPDSAQTRRGAPRMGIAFLSLSLSRILSSAAVFTRSFLPRRLPGLHLLTLALMASDEHLNRRLNASLFLCITGYHKRHHRALPDIGYGARMH